MEASCLSPFTSRTSSNFCEKFSCKSLRTSGRYHAHRSSARCRHRYVRVSDYSISTLGPEYGNIRQWRRGNWGAVSHNLVDRGSGYRTREGRVEVLIVLAAWQTPMVTLTASVHARCRPREVSWILIFFIYFLHLVTIQKDKNNSFFVNIWDLGDSTPN